MKNRKRMKYLQIFESFLGMNEIMDTLRRIAMKIIQDMPKADGEMTIDDYKIEISFDSDLVDGIRQLLAIIRQNEVGIGSILLDFENSEFPGSIVVLYTVGIANEGNSLYCREEKFDRDLLDSDKIRKRIDLKNKLSESLKK